MIRATIADCRHWTTSPRTAFSEGLQYDGRGRQWEDGAPVFLCPECYARLCGERPLVTAEKTVYNLPIPSQEVLDDINPAYAEQLAKDRDDLVNAFLDDAPKSKRRKR